MSLDPHMKARSRTLRRAQTPEEIRLWKHLRRRQIDGVRFGRQRVIGTYVVDFLAPELSLIIELDGSQHFFESQRQAEIDRERFLQSKGFHLLRFGNHEIREHMGSVMEAIWLKVRELKAAESR